MAALCTLSCRPSDSFLGLIMEDDRVGRTLNALDEALQEEGVYIANLPYFVYSKIAEVTGFAAEVLLDESINAALVSVA